MSTCQGLSQCVNALGRHDRRCPAAPVTAVDVDALDAARARLAAALNGAGSLGCEEFDPNDLDSGCPDCEDLLRAVDALLPVVQALVAEGAAAKLRASADDLVNVPGNPYPLVVSEFLYDRATALTAGSEANR